MGRRKSIRDTSGKAIERKGKSGGELSPGKLESARKKRIVSLRKHVSGGTYRVDPNAVAEKMVDDAVSKIRSRIRPQ